jgi:hypothetical protein
MRLKLSFLDKIKIAELSNRYQVAIIIIWVLEVSEKTLGSADADVVIEHFCRVKTIVKDVK